jgi:RepB DNA-primase from phage plasmid
MVARISDDRGRCVTGMVLRRQIAAMPCRFYEVRLIHSGSRKAYPGVRHWTASQLLNPAAVSFLRIRNREGYDVYFRPYAGDHNAGYILLDLDHPVPGILARLRAQGHDPSILVETSPGRLQAWIRVSHQPLPPALATLMAKRLAHIHAADLASADWRHLGRLVGFTNRKSMRRQSDGLAPWVKLIYGRGCLARGGAALIEHVVAELPTCAPIWNRPAHQRPSTSLDSTALRILYQTCLAQLRILERYPFPDWSIADKWIARALLQSGTPLARIAAVLRHGSPGFPRRHGDPEDYLRRTICCAARQIHSSVFPARTPRSLD